jgi:hypothetical protein
MAGKKKSSGTLFQLASFWERDSGTAFWHKNTPDIKELVNKDLDYIHMAEVREQWQAPYTSANCISPTKCTLTAVLAVQCNVSALTPAGGGLKFTCYNPHPCCGSTVIGVRLELIGFGFVSWGTRIFSGKVLIKDVSENNAFFGVIFCIVEVWAHW